jgi:hypothetical protein
VRLGENIEEQRQTGCETEERGKCPPLDESPYGHPGCQCETADDVDDGFGFVEELGRVVMTENTLDRGHDEPRAVGTP